MDLAIWSTNFVCHADSCRTRAQCILALATAGLGGPPQGTMDATRPARRDPQKRAQRRKCCESIILAPSRTHLISQPTNSNEPQVELRPNSEYQTKTREENAKPTQLYFLSGKNYVSSIITLPETSTTLLSQELFSITSVEVLQRLLLILSTRISGRVCNAASLMMFVIL